jgi:predicted HicB family RNase H-like nuclease
MSKAVHTPGTMARVPNKPKTPIRSFRIDPELYAAVQEKAAERGETVTDVVVQALQRYVKRK